MSEVVVAKRYADALFQLGLEKTHWISLKKNFPLSKKYLIKTSKLIHS